MSTSKVQNSTSNNDNTMVSAANTAPASAENNASDVFKKDAGDDIDEDETSWENLDPDDPTWDGKRGSNNNPTQGVKGTGTNTGTTVKK